jgi:16S rRNA (cytosine967-C5)-methyltransferase
MPAHAAVHETVELVRSNRGFANALLRKLSQAIEHRTADPAAATTELPLGPERMLRLPLPLPDDPIERLAIVHSLPDFLLQRWRHQFGDDGVQRVAAAASAVPDVFLRVVAGRSRDELQAELATAGVICEPAAHELLLRWTGGGSPFASAPFRQGAFVVQDPTALAAALAMPCGPGATVVDLCAAPGTKTTLLAERVRPGGRVLAFDPEGKRRERIAENVARLRLQGTVTIVADAATLPVADAVLADVPCSNSGVLGRRVEVRLRLDEHAFGELAGLQRQLLTQAIGLCKPGGAVVYSTCSIDREENGDVVAAVIAAVPDRRCTIEREQLTLPDAGHCDGGYFAVLRVGG